MTQWLQLSNEQRLNTLYEVNRQTGLPLQAIEKDWWVTLALKATFQTPYAKSLLFKGGTSLSSADLRIAIERELSDLNVPPQAYSLTAAEIGDPDKDPQQLFLRYASLLDPITYIQSEVQIEVSGRSLREPWRNKPVQSFIDNIYPDQPFVGASFEVPTVEPRRTFLEKAFLLHEEFLKPAEKIRSNRMSRHLYDLDVLMDTEHGITALEDEELYYSIIDHRAKFNRLPGVDYGTHAKETISFLPPDSVVHVWESDYNSMRETMFYGNTKPFSVLMERLQQLQERFRGSIKTTK